MTTGTGSGPRRAVGLLLAALPLLLLGCGAPAAGEAGSPAAPTPRTPQHAATAAPRTYPPKDPQPLPTPTVDSRSTEERAAEYTAGFNDFMARRAQWIAAFQASGKDASKLPRATKSSSSALSATSLLEALQQADLVVEGTVVSATYAPTGTVGTVRVATTHKVSARAATRLGTQQPSEIRVELGYSPEPDRDFSTGILAISETQPLLLPGAHAMLFLQESKAEGLPPFFIQSYTGGYAIDASGRIIPVPHNPFAEQVRWLPSEQFARLIVSELGKLAP